MNKKYIPFSMLRTMLLGLICAMLGNSACSQTEKKTQLLEEVRALADSFKGKIGIGVKGLDFEDSFFFNNEIKFPMQSVYKFPLAMVILDKVDKGKLRLEEVLEIKRSALDKETWSPLFKDSTKEIIKISIAELLRYSVSKSDNNACDLLFEQAGGTAGVHKYFQKLGIKGMAVMATEAEMHKDWQAQYTNWCYPEAMLKILSLFYQGKLLKPESNAFLMKLMTESENSPKRIMGLLPKNTVVAHKTGTGGQNDKGMIAATNDVGIVTLSNGKHYALVIYLCNYEGTYEQGELLIAKLSKKIWDYYAK